MQDVERRQEQFPKQEQSEGLPPSLYGYSSLSSGLNADIEGARYVKGFRASRKNSTLSPSQLLDTAPIRYDENDRPSALRLSLLFESRQRAMEFSTKLRNWKFNHPMLGSSLEEIQVDDLPARVPLRGHLSPIMLNDYDPSEADDSPCTCLADFRGFASILPTEPIQLTEPLSKYQSIESESVFALRTKPIQTTYQVKGKVQDA